MSFATRGADRDGFAYCAQLIRPKLDKHSTSSQDCDHRQFTQKRTYKRALNVNVLLYLLFILCSISSLSKAQITNCDYTGSGLDVDGTGVQPVYLSCTSGRVQWDYPRGALRVLLKLPHSDGQFRACIKPKPSIEGARLFLEGHRSLIAVYPDGGLGPTRCFTSYKGQVAIYVEAVPSVHHKQTTVFEYDLQAQTGDLYDADAECRPCTNSELVRHYCAADFVATGQFVHEEQSQDLDMTVVTFSATRVFQQSTPIFSSGSTKHSQNKETRTNSLETTLEEPRFSGLIQIPSHCHARAGPGQFLVLGYLRLGDPLLKCAAKMEDWSRLVKSAQNDAHCVLEI